MQLEEFFDYKNRLMEDILTNKDIVSLIADEDDVPDSTHLAYSQVFPYEYVPKTLEHGQTFVCFDVDIQKSMGNGLLYTPTIYVWVFSHISKMRLPEGGVRTDMLCAKIANALDGSRYYGLGELELYAAKRFAPVSDYQGKVLTFTARDIKRTNPTGKPIPSNRRLG